jgi:hypothetical protein
MKKALPSYLIQIMIFISIIPGLNTSGDIIVDNIEPVVDKCIDVKSPVLIECEVMGKIRLIGLKSIDENSKYFKSGTEFVKKRIEGKEVLLDICHINPQTKEGYIRAVVFYDLDGKWWNLNVEMVHEGIVRVVPVLNSHVDPKAWLSDEKYARENRLGIWENFKPGEFFDQ